MRVPSLPTQRRLVALAAAALVVAGAMPALAAPVVVASIKPIHSLVAAVMQGAGTPELIVSGASSPHNYALKPSDAVHLQRADLVVWVGPDLENFLISPLATLSSGEKLLTLEGVTGVKTLAPRVGGTFEADTDGDQAGRIDPHIWLDPLNARAMVDAIAERLSAMDPDNADLYSANARAEDARLDALIVQTRADLAPIKGKPFVVFHDAYHYFENRFGLSASGSIVVEPDVAPGVQRLRAIRARVEELGATCVFSEPEFEPRLVDTLIEGTAAKKGVLDPLGAAIPQGPDHYFSLIRALSGSLVACLG
ncbi:MAG TPA: zinc ABC transporter substrate-binding protein [Devosiaceae bacterium]